MVCSFFCFFLGFLVSKNITDVIYSVVLNAKQHHRQYRNTIECHDTTQVPKDEGKHTINITEAAAEAATAADKITQR